MKAVLLAAGFGSRLWPLSTPEKPKQFLPLVHHQSLLQYTYHLYSHQINPSELYVLTKSGLESQVGAQLPGLAASHLISVPARRNILPHTLFSLNWLDTAPDEPVLFAAVDYITSDKVGFDASLAEFLAGYNSAAGVHDVILLADSKESPFHTGYVKIENDRVVAYRDNITKSQMSSLSWYRFPCIFITSKTALRRALEFMPDKEIAEQAKKLLDANKQDLNTLHRHMPFIGTIFAFPTTGSQYISAPNTKAHIHSLGLKDIGTFAGLYDVSAKDSQKNVAVGNVIVDDTSNSNLLINHTKEPLVVVHTTQSVIVRSTHGSLACPLSKADKIGHLYKTAFGHPV